MAHRSPPIAHRWPPLPTGGPPVATAKTVTATEVATDGTAVEDRWPPMDFPGLSTRVPLPGLGLSDSCQKFLENRMCTNNSFCF